MSARLPGAVRRILDVGWCLAPVRRRALWRCQWVAEIEHRVAGGAADVELVRFALGSIPHALYLRREETTMRGWAADVRHAGRSLLRRPGFSALTVVTLALGIGAATAIFSLAEALLFRPLPLEDSDRLVRIYSTNRAEGFDRFSVSYPDYADFTGRADLFEASSLYLEQRHDISGDGEPERVRSAAVHSGFFQTLRSPARLGRMFSADDHDARSESTAILAESFWARRFGADSTVIGRTVRLNGVPHTVVGVVEDRHAWPLGVQLWTPLQWGGSVPEYAAARTNHTWNVVGRLHPGVRVVDADDQVKEMARAIYAAPDIDARDVNTGAVVVALHSSEGGDGAGELFGMLGAAVLLVLLISCINASGLLLTRARSRGRELSLRSALGAGRARLVLVLLGESTVLALAGGALGVLVGHLGLKRALAVAPPEIAVLADVKLNGVVLAGGVGISVLAAGLAGLAPALRASRISVADALKEGGAGSGGGKSRRSRRALVVAELAFSLVLLVGAGLTIRGFQRQITSDPGFDASNLLTFTVRLPGTRYGEVALVDAFYAEAVSRLERHPGIMAATSTSRLPLGAGGLSLGRSFIFEGATPPPEGAEFGAGWVEVDPGYFETLGVGMRAGRAFTDDDGAEAPLVAIVNERMARQMSPDEPIVGKVIRSFYDENLPRTVVGVMPDLQFNGVSRSVRRPLVLVPREQSVRTSMAFLVRTVSDPTAMIPLVRETMGEIDGDVALDALVSLRDAHAADLAGIRFLTTILGTFGLLALVLAVSGVYGLVSYSVTQRTQEIGVRMAMGATRMSVRGTVIRESALMAAAGLTIGLLLAYVAGRVLAYGMDGIAVLEPSTYVAVTLLLAVAVLAASWFPASRATLVDPVEALRSE